MRFVWKSLFRCVRGLGGGFFFVGINWRLEVKLNAQCGFYDCGLGMSNIIVIHLFYAAVSHVLIRAVEYPPYLSSREHWK